MKEDIDTYIPWANSLDSTGTDSTQAQARLRGPAINSVLASMKSIIRTGAVADDLKKRIFYGKVVELEALGSHHTQEEIAGAGVAFREHNTIRMYHSILGLVTEAAELMEQLYTHVSQGETIDKTSLIDETGDIFWYLALMAKALGLHTFDEFMLTNKAKLVKRYGTDWSMERALNRDLGSEIDAINKELLSGVPNVQINSTPKSRNLIESSPDGSHVRYPMNNKKTVVDESRPYPEASSVIHINSVNPENHMETEAVIVDGRPYYPVSDITEKWTAGQLGKSLASFDTLDKIVNQLSACIYKSEHSGGLLENNSAFMALKQMAKNARAGQDDPDGLESPVG